MYIDCETCGFMSGDFCPLGVDYASQVIKNAEINGCVAIKNSNGSFSFKCPNGHTADLLPTEVKFRKKYKYSQTKH